MLGQVRSNLLPLPGYASRAGLREKRDVRDRSNTSRGTPLLWRKVAELCLDYAALSTTARF